MCEGSVGKELHERVDKVDWINFVLSGQLAPLVYGHPKSPLLPYTTHWMGETLVVVYTWMP